VAAAQAAATAVLHRLILLRRNRHHLSRAIAPSHSAARRNQCGNLLLQKQMDAHTMVIVLSGGEEIEGTIEWYDRGAFKINRKSAPNLWCSSGTSNTCTR
jgi:hypothetical protein